MDFLTDFYFATVLLGLATQTLGTAFFFSKS